MEFLFENWMENSRIYNIKAALQKFLKYILGKAEAVLGTLQHQIWSSLQ